MSVAQLDLLLKMNIWPHTHTHKKQKRAYEMQKWNMIILMVIEPASFKSWRCRSIHTVYALTQPYGLKPCNMCKLRRWMFNPPVAPHVIHKSTMFRRVGFVWPYNKVCVEYSMWPQSVCIRTQWYYFMMSFSWFTWTICAILE